MATSWDERFSDPKLIELAERLDIELSEGELKGVKRRINAVECSKFKSIVGVPLFVIIGLVINTAMLLSLSTYALGTPLAR